MTKKEEMIRLILNPDKDQPIYDFFIEIKKQLGLKVNTEVVRYCIKKTYELMFTNRKED